MFCLSIDFAIGAAGAIRAKQLFDICNSLYRSVYIYACSSSTLLCLTCSCGFYHLFQYYMAGFLRDLNTCEKTSVSCAVNDCFVVPTEIISVDTKRGGITSNVISVAEAASVVLFAVDFSQM